jgi:hypothetical protein
VFNQGRGVTAPQNQGNPANAGPANTVIQAVEVKFVAVEFFNGEGRRGTDILLEMNGEYYAPPNSAQWAAALKGVAKWMKEGLAKKMPSGNVRVPTTVDILSEE